MPTADNGAKLDVPGKNLLEETTSCLFNLRMPDEAIYWIDDVNVWAGE